MIFEVDSCFSHFSFLILGILIVSFTLVSDLMCLHCLSHLSHVIFVEVILTVTLVVLMFLSCVMCVGIGFPYTWCDMCVDTCVFPCSWIDTLSLLHRFTLILCLVCDVVFITYPDISLTYIVI